MGETEFEVYRTGWESAISVIAFCAFRPNAFAWASVRGDADNSQGKLMLAAMLGARGFTASQSALEGRGGYFESFVQKWTLEPFADLGSRYDLAEMGYRLKAYPSGGLGHTTVDAALELRELVALDDIAVSTSRLQTLPRAASPTNIRRPRRAPSSAAPIRVDFCRRIV